MGMSVWWVTFSFLSPRQPPRSPLFPYTTLFRSRPARPREFFADVEPPRDREVFADVEPRPSTPERVDPAQWPRREPGRSLGELLHGPQVEHAEPSMPAGWQPPPVPPSGPTSGGPSGQATPA